MLRHVWRSLSTTIMAQKPPREPLIVVLGATGTGKSQLAIDLAKRFDGEIINGDAMQMYQGLPIVTNKVTAEEQQGIPHHLLGFIALDEEPWRVGMFKQRAGQIIKEIRSRGRLPILVGGTHYYTQSLLFEHSLVDEGAEEEENTQDEFSQQDSAARFPILDGPTELMMDKLREVDPIMADRWHPKDRRRIRRSLEIFLTKGVKASDIYARQRDIKLISKDDSHENTSNALSTLLFWVHSEAGVLKKRLDSRIDRMITSGLLEEVTSMDNFLLKQTETGVSVDKTRGIWVSIGWKEFEPYLKALRSGTAIKEEMETLYSDSVEQTKSATRQYAKRQVRWIRHKLITALVEAGSIQHLFLLDGSDISKWDEAVANPAIDIARSFLEGQILPHPEELSALAKLFFTPEMGEPKDSSFHRECEICSTTFVIEEQWDVHLKSRRHRAMIKRREKHEAIEKYRKMQEGGLDPHDGT